MKTRWIYTLSLIVVVFLIFNIFYFSGPNMTASAIICNSNGGVMLTVTVLLIGVGAIGGLLLYECVRSKR